MQIEFTLSGMHRGMVPNENSWMKIDVNMHLRKLWKIYAVKIGKFKLNKVFIPYFTQ